jgi:glycosyltransferase involved in cell wall biosynthesis
MRVLVSASAHFGIAKDGSLWTPNASLDNRFWNRYLDVFSEVQLLVRATPYEFPPVGWNRVSGPRITAIPIPDFVGFKGLVQNYSTVRRIVKQAIAQAEAIQLRIPCAIGQEVGRSLEKGRPYGVEVVADPYDMFAPGAMRHPLRPLFRYWFSRQLRHQCAGACVASYVTEYALQRRYPATAATFSTYYSSIDLTDADYVQMPRLYGGDRSLTLISVGTFAQLYKAPDVIIEAVAQCVQAGLSLKLVFVGDGLYRRELENRVAALGLTDHVQFCGELRAGNAVQAQLDQADLFILPSRQEGLPRAMLEAMARALPCIGSTVGGIPEILPSDDLVLAGDVNGLAEKICEIATNPERLSRMSQRNLTKAKEYHRDILQQRRNALYCHLRDQTEAWQQQRVSVEQPSYSILNF